MGVGLTFIESLMDEMNIDSTIGTGTVVTMFKKKSSFN
jgi:anti-sigma regulatory factor (Ser/Thr protein kinase)